MENNKPRNHQENDDQETILILRGSDGKNGLADLLLFKENKWSELSLKLPKSTAAHGTAYLNGEIYIFGGGLGKEVYKLDKSLKWVRLADMNEKRDYISKSCLEWNGYIWVLGGSSDLKAAKSLKSVERYDPKENKWTEMRSMNHARRSAAPVVWNGKFIICGGTWVKQAMRNVEYFDPISGVWTDLDNLPARLSGHSIIPYRNRLILIGGWKGNRTMNSVLELNNVEGKLVWKDLPSMGHNRAFFSAVVVNDEIYVIGGWDGKVLIGTEIFDGTKWRDGPDLPHENRHMGAIAIPQNFADTLFNYML